MWKYLVAAAAAAGIGCVVAVNMPDLKRYLRIRSM
ncbi:DUF6893 family small protein [Streptantibioticus parmotrematis]